MNWKGLSSATATRHLRRTSLKDSGMISFIEMSQEPHTRSTKNSGTLFFWQQVTLDWVGCIEVPYPSQPSAGFPTRMEGDRESWAQLCQRFLDGCRKAAAITREAEKLEQVIRCPSRPGAPVRTMSVREQLESLAAHNAYHFGRIVLLRQFSGAWPPPSGGFSL
jgi:hypothetical protein